MKKSQAVLLILIIICFLFPFSNVYASHYYHEDNMAKLVSGTIHRDLALNMVDWNAKGKNPVKVAILDSGADMGNDAYPEGIFDKKHSVHVGDGYKEYSPITKDRTGHGNAVTRKLITTLGGKEKAKDYIRIMEIDIFDKHDSDIANYSSGSQTMAKGIRYAVDHGAQVINISHSRKTSSDSKFAKNINQAVNYAVNKGCIVVTSGGNIPNDQERYPACADSAIPVMVCQSDWQDAWSKEDTVIEKSNYGQNRKISAPGMGYTSLAAPTVTGVLAMMKYVDPDLNAQKAKIILYDTATDIYKEGFDSKTGYGCVNAYRAISRLLGKEISVPELDAVSFTVSRGDFANIIRWDKVPDASYYNIYRATSEAGPYQIIRTVSASSGLHIVCDRNTDKDKNYFYQMLACDTRSHYKAYSRYSITIPVLRHTKSLLDLWDRKTSQEECAVEFSTLL